MAEVNSHHTFIMYMFILNKLDSIRVHKEYSINMYMFKVF